MKSTTLTITITGNELDGYVVELSEGDDVLWRRDHEGEGYDRTAIRSLKHARRYADTLVRWEQLRRTTAIREVTVLTTERQS